MLVRFGPDKGTMEEMVVYAAKSKDPKLRLVSDDEDIYHRIRSQQSSGAELIYDHFHNDIEGLVWRLLGGDPEHRDVVQLVYCEILSSIFSLKKPASLRSWIRSVTARTVHKELRRRTTRRKYFSANPGEDFDTEGAVAADPETREVLRRAREALNTLPADQRIAFLLRYVEQYSLGELAESLGCSERNARRKLRLAEAGFEALARKDTALRKYLDETEG